MNMNNFRVVFYFEGNNLVLCLQVTEDDIQITNNCGFCSAPLASGFSFFPDNILYGTHRNQ